ncbi:amidase family protein [Herbiconiux daphne]|uniref:Amidase family protein n=1 Tax=Herbiconiux daphne TaxID=2970914 RepID=A0ABT2H430_9MICO|nr:amidase family protein [Herbiconiux daphne]MCS5734691.1 amidase family protein [Herbiconiux daphne]
MDATTDSLAQLDATTMLAALEARELSAVELLERHLALIEARNPELNAVVATDAASARATAADVDRRRAAGEAVGALAGLPMTVKDSFDVRGLRTSQGRLSDSRVAGDDAPVVARVRAADAILLGKTNLPLFLADSQTVNDDFGRTDNPWNAEHTPGGSSGGSAASVSAGFAAGEIASDLSGSIRVPASWCGLFGHRPSNGVISKQGHMPWPEGGLLEPSLSATGPLARSAVDLDRLTRVMMGAAPQDAVGWRLDLPAPRVTQLDGARVALWLDDPAAPVDDETRQAIELFAQRLEDSGCLVTELTAPPVVGDAAMRLFERLQAAELVHALDDESWSRLVDIAGQMPGAAGSAESSEIENALLYTQPVRATWADWQQQRRIAAEWNAVFETVDVVLAPTVPTVAPCHSTVPAESRTLLIDGWEHPAQAVIGAWSRLASLGRGPSTVVPLGAGAASGLPVGAQLIGPYLEDFTPLHVAVIAEREGLIAHEPPPGW